MPEPRIEFDVEGSRGSLPIERDVFTLGRHKDNDACFESREVSHHHAQILKAGQGCVIRDLQSRFGTFVNDQQVSGDQPLEDGDRIRLGLSAGAEFVFYTGEPGARKQARPTSTVIVPAEGSLTHVAALLEGLRALGAGRELDAVLAVVVDSAVALSGAERGYVFLATPSGELDIVPRMARTRGKQMLEERQVVVSKTITQSVFAQGKAEVVESIEEVAGKGRFQRTFQFGIRSAICVPLRLADRRPEKPASPTAADMRTIGVLYVDSRKRTRFVSPTTRTSLEVLADEAAVAIENARLLRESEEKRRLDADLQRASRMQLDLLPPRLHSRGPVEIAGNTLPCSAVGGDFFDYFDAEERLVFAVADVSGKGMPAALLAAQTQGILFSHAEAIDCPARVMSLVSRALARRSTGRSFVTIACGMLWPNGRLQCCSGGHNPGLVARADGPIEVLKKGGLMLGPFGAATYEKDDTQLAPGDSVILYSDGVTEAENARSEFFGEERLCDCLKGRAGHSAREIQELLFRAVSEFSGDTAQGDDITVLVVRYLGPGR